PSFIEPSDFVVCVDLTPTTITADNTIPRDIRSPGCPLLNQWCVVIDGKGHLLGRLASTVAKQLLNGQKIVVVRCEALNISGEFFRAKLKYHAYLRKMTRFNPTRGGPFHFRAPSRILYKAIRGMIPHKTPRGAAALERLKVFEGVPLPTTRRSVSLSPRLSVSCACAPAASTAPLAVSATRLAGSTRMLFPGILEERRKVKSKAYYERKKAARRNLVKAEQGANVDSKTKTQLAQYGY
ncbi:hypothetical protein N7457_009339, partial [Penicillium paradoxum]|uniref:uncharacterized protein n=1 Tax=Penicillium paradoxum TaxID=176176 RepID=UPI002547F23F